MHYLEEDPFKSYQRIIDITFFAQNTSNNLTFTLAALLKAIANTAGHSPDLKINHAEGKHKQTNKLLVVCKKRNDSHFVNFC